MRGRRCLFCFLTIVWPLLLLAQQEESLYIRSFRQNVAVSVNLGKPYLAFTQKTPSGSYNYQPNNPVKGGIGIAIRNTLINFNLGQEFNFLRDKKRGKTKAFDLQMHHYGGSYVVDLYIQKYRGFYTENEADEVTGLYPDLEIRQYGLHGQYVFNHKKFSYKAAFPQSEIQLRSAGSALLGGCVYYTEMTADSAFIKNGSRALQNFQFGVNGGYVHTWVLDNHWFINASILVGVNVGNEKIRDFGRRRLEVYPFSFPRIAVGYNRDRWAVGLTGLTSITFLSTGHRRSTNLFSGKIQISFIRRFQVSRKPFRIRN